MFSSAKRVHAIHPPVPQILSQLRVEMPVQKMRWRRSQMLKWGQSRCEVTQREPVRRGRIVQTRSTWKHACILLVSAADVTLMKFWRQLPESDQNPYSCKWRRRCKRSSMQTVISTRMPHEAKRNRAQPRIVLPEHADAMRVSDLYASTPCTRMQKLMINSMMSRCRTCHPESYDTLSAFFHDWFERGMWTEPPTDPRLNDGWCWQPVRAFLLPESWGERSVVCQEASTRRQTRSTWKILQVSLKSRVRVRVADSCRIHYALQEYGSRLVSRFEPARGLPELWGGKLHGRHSVSARGAHAGGELVAKPMRRSTWTRKQSQPR